MKYRHLILLVFMPLLVTAEPKYWLKKDNPNELSVGISIDDDCPFSSSDAREIVHDVLIRSRIKPSEGISIDVGFPILKMTVTCTADQREPEFFHGSLEHDFWTLTGIGDEFISVDVRLGSTPFRHTSFTGSKDYILSTIRDGTEDVIADYLRVNFDLGEDD